MTKPRKTCDKCQYYAASTASTGAYEFAGSCALMGDSNDRDPRCGESEVTGWDYEGYRAGVYVGPKFGCIHWSKK